jgi:hypothetical protein
VTDREKGIAAFFYILGLAAGFLASWILWVWKP